MAANEGEAEPVVEEEAAAPTVTLAVRGVAGPLTVVLTKKVSGVLATEVVMPVGLVATDGQVEVQTLLAKGDPEKAVVAAKQCLAKCKEVPEKETEEVLALTLLSRAHLEDNESPEALMTIEDAVKRCKAMDDGVLEAKTLLTLAEVHRRTGKPAEAEKALRTALEAFESVEGGDEHHLAVTKTLLSIAVLAQGDIDEGIDLADKSREHVKGAGEQEQVVLLTVADAYCAARQPDEALALAQEALALAEEAQNKPSQMYALSTVAKLHRSRESFPEALDTCKQMRAMCHSAKMYDGEAYSLIETADVHLAEHQGKAAVKAALAAVKICLKNGQSGIRVIALLKVVEAYMQLVADMQKAFVVSAKLQKEFDTAAQRGLEAASEAAKLAERTEDAVLRARAQYWFGKALHIVDKQQESLEAGGKAMFLFNRLGMKESEGDATLVVAKSHYKIDSTKQWAANACYDALDIFRKLGDEAGKERVYDVMQECGVALRVAGAAGVALPAAAAEGGGAAMAAPGDAAPGGGASLAEAKPKGLDPEMVMGTVQEMAKAAIGLDDAVYLDSPLMDSGMDSLTAVSFRNGLQQNLGVKLPSSLMFDYPTMKDVAQRIVELSLEDA